MEHDNPMSTKAKKASKKRTATAANKAKKASVNVAASTAAALAAQNAESTAQPGIISTIMTALIDAKTANSPLTTAEILAHLVKQFPERPSEGMLTTVRAQLSRLPVQKKFKITKIRDGKNMRYAAA